MTKTRKTGKGFITADRDEEERKEVFSIDTSEDE